MTRPDRGSINRSPLSTALTVVTPSGFGVDSTEEEELEELKGRVGGGGLEAERIGVLCIVVAVKIGEPSGSPANVS